MDSGGKRGKEDPEKAKGGNHGPTLSVVIITKDTRDLLENLLRSIEADSLGPVLGEITVIDNGSKDGTDVMVREKFPSVTLVGNERNRGFAASANEGFRRSSGDFIIFLNSDTLLIPGDVMKMLDFMASNGNVGICGPQLVYPDMRTQRSSAAIPSALFEIFPRSLVEGLGGRKEGKGGGDSSSLEVESLIGAAVMAKRKALEEIGGFDERFFFFLEETDLCMRLAQKGYGVVLFPGARVIHLQGETVRKNWVKGRLEYNISMYKFMKKHHTCLYYRSYQSVRLIKASVFVALLTILPFLLVSGRTRRSYKYYTSLVGWHMRGCPDNAGLRPAE